MLAGEYRSLFRGQGMEFTDLRPYEEGDDVRQIDWNVTARTGTPYIRLFREERSRSLTLLADISPSITPNKRDLLLRLAALLSFAAAYSRDRVGLIAFTDKVEHLVPPASGRNAALRLLSDLMTLSPRGMKTQLAPPLEALMAAQRRPGMAVLLSDLHAELPESLLRRTAARHDLMVLALRDGAERRLPPAGPVAFRDAETGTERLLHLNPRRIAAIETAWKEADRSLAASLRRIGIDHAFVETDADPLATLHAFFRSRKGRRP